MNKFYIYPGNNSYLVKEALLRRGSWQENSEDPNPFANCQFIWKPTNLSISDYIKLDSISKCQPKNSSQVFNHFENIRGICTKTGLVRSLKKYYTANYDSRQVNYNVFDSTPTSFLITAGVDDAEYSAFIARYRDIVKQNFSKEAVPQKHAEGNIWLVKPANLNQGRGIEVFKNLKDINNFLSQRPYNSFWVVQKYVEHPLLYKQRKFDIRIWVVITAKNEIFLYKHAYIRTSSDDYDLNTSKNYVHLTNNCLQKNGENYGKHEDGNTLPFDALDEYFKEMFPEHDVKVASHIIPRIKDLIIDTFLCTKKNINPQHRKNVFELFGFDFLIDEDLRTWLIEVNTNPYLGLPNKYISKILPEMLDDMLEIVVDPLFPPKTNPRSADRPNYYELIYCDNNSAYHNGSLNTRSPFTKNVYPVQALIPQDVAKKLSGSGKNHESIHNYYQQTSNVTKTNENEENLDEGDDENGMRSSSVEPKTDNNANNIEWIYNRLCSMMNSHEINIEFIGRQIERIFGCLKNWEILSDREVKIACKSLLVAAQSPAGYLLAEQSNIVTIAKLLRSNNLKPETKFGLIDTINTLAKDINLKKKLICNYLLHNLMTLCLSSCDEKEIQSHNKGFLIAVLKCLINLGGVFNRKLYIPGETREATKLRTFFIAQGGIITIWLISKKSLIEEMKEHASKHFLNHLELSDWERQLQVLEMLVSMPKSRQKTERPNSRNKLEADNLTNNAQEKQNNGELSTRTESEAIFYKTGEINAMEKIFMEKMSLTKADTNDKSLEKIVKFPRSLLKMVSLEALRDEFLEYVIKFREAWLKREEEDREKRQTIEIEKIKKVESRKKELEEQRKQALEGFEKRVKENLKKQQADLERRQKEIEEMKHREVEERKRNIENLMLRKADREKKQMRVQAHRQEAKKNKNHFFYKENRDKSETKPIRVSRSRTPERSPDAVKKIQKNSLGFKKVENLNKTDTIRKSSYTRGKENEVTAQIREMATEVDEQNKKGLVRLNSRSSSSYKASPIPDQEFNEQYFLASKPLGESLRDSHLQTNQNSNSNIKVNRDSHSMNESANGFKGNNRDNFKLPKIQKAGRTLINQKAAQSPYLKNIQEPLSADSKSKKEKPVRKEIDVSPYIASNINTLIAKVKLQV